MVCHRNGHTVSCGGSHAAGDAKRAVGRQLGYDFGDGQGEPCISRYGVSHVIPQRRVGRRSKMVAVVT
jgi:hypothetical protein